MLTCFLFFSLALSQAAAFYRSTDDVVELTAKQFKSDVLKGDELWLVEFYAPWCGHCKNLIPEYKKVATAVKGVAKIGALDGTNDDAKDIMQKYSVQGFPTLKFFGANKRTPKDYEGQRTGDAMITEVVKQVGRMVKERTKGSGGAKSSSSSSGNKQKPSGGGSKKGSSSAVIELTESNFNALVMDSNDQWLVEFFAPWCGHCKNLAPEWENAAKQLKGSVQLGAVDATEHGSLASKYGVKGYPTIKVFPAGKKKKAKDYNGPREAAGIVSYALQLLDEAGVAPSIPQITSDKVFESTCTGNQKLCVIMFVPHILDSLAKGRNQYLDTLGAVAKSLRGSPYSFAWSEGGAQMKLEEDMGLTFGYPAAVVISAEKKVYSVQRGSWSKKNLASFLNGVISGSEKTASLKSIPKMKEVAAWDGKDAPEDLISTEEYSLEDLMAD